MAQGEAAGEERFQSHCDWIAAVRAEYERQVRAAGEASLDRLRHGAWSALRAALVWRLAARPS